MNTRTRRSLAVTLGLAALVIPITAGFASADEDPTAGFPSTQSPTQVVDSLVAALSDGGTTPGDGGTTDPEPCVVSEGVTQTPTTVTGTAGNDTIDCGGASPGKTITGGDGNDTITGTNFDDSISGGDGNDTITGGPGNDDIDAGAGENTVTQ